MKRIFRAACCAMPLYTISIMVFSQGSSMINSAITHAPGGMTFSSSMSLSNSQSFNKDFGQYSMHPIMSNGSINGPSSAYGAKGTRMLFEDWVKGVVVKNSGEVIDGNKYFFNFDKVTNNLIVTLDKNSVIEVYKEYIQSFRFSEKGKVYSFEKVIPIQRFRFVQVLVKDSAKYSLYKSINTRFVAANFTTNGLTESGEPYDEFVDMHKYYIVYQDAVRPVDLKFTSIKKALKENSSRVKDFYAAHLMDEVDENYLTGIVEFLNQ